MCAFFFVNQGSASEVMMLRTARRYDMETDTIIFGNGTPMTKESLRFGGKTQPIHRFPHFVTCVGLLFIEMRNMYNVKF